MFFLAHPLLPFHSALWKYNEMSKLTKSQRKNCHTRHRQQQEQYWMHKTKTIKKFQIHFSHKPTVKRRQRTSKERKFQSQQQQRKLRKTSEFLICGTKSVQWELSVECKQFSSPRWHRSAAVELNDKIWNLNAKLILRWARLTIIILPCVVCVRAGTIEFVVVLSRYRSTFAYSFMDDFHMYAMATASSHPLHVNHIKNREFWILAKDTIR